VREGRWKYYRFDGEDPELYDLAAAMGEMENLAAQHPETVRRLDAVLQEHLERTVAVLPVPNEKHDPAAASPMTADGRKQEGKVEVR
jgi:arylsulfatase A-like enzyme